ncbi:putative bifunctional diguanylate cyclase/phosphodiesterase [Polymorphum gilvum]|uniref:putative bifunctional diguanylate cyclase/phosphodiesterase n=1 Tax=Polymorphum gilvum TaxID=991904 RepID=UPI000306933B|nr:EAL domain-containing protein [Polymorphum gilvum]
MTDSARNTLLASSASDPEDPAGADARLDDLLRLLPQPFAFVSGTGVVLRANAGFAELFGLGLGCAAGRSLADLVGEAGLHRLRPVLEAARAGVPARTETWLAPPHAEPCFAEVACRPAGRAAGVEGAVVVLAHDLTEQAQVRARLRFAEQAFAALSGRAYLIGPDLRIRAGLCAGGARQRSQADEAGAHVADLVGRAVFDNVLEAPLRKALAGRPARLYALVPDGDDGAGDAEIHVGPFVGEDDAIEGALLVLRSDELACQRTRELERLAMEDPLTGLANRRAFQKSLEEELTKARTGISEGFALLAIDLDDFKALNDRGGHAAGDAMLCRIAAQLGALAAERGCVARLGGDEFAVLRYGADQDEANRLARSIVEALEAIRLEWDGALFRVGCSIGVAVLDRQFVRTMNATAKDVLHWADQACLTGKATGGGQVRQFQVGDPLLAARRDDLANVATVEQALADDRLTLFAMPVVDLATGTPVMDEILLRVRGEGERILRPGGMIASAERHGLMRRIDHWVIDGVLDRLTGEPGLGPVSVNLSAQTIGDPLFLETLQARLALNPRLAARLCFELAETAVARDTVAAATLVATLKDHGCRVAMDDFGGGWSTSAHLRQLQLDWLKIDGSIVRTIASDPVQHAVVKGIVCVARELGIDLIAEHVEDPDTADMLQDLGVAMGQGFLFGEPAPWRAL